MNGRRTMVYRTQQRVVDEFASPLSPDAMQQHSISHRENKCPPVCYLPSIEWSRQPSMPAGTWPVPLCRSTALVSMVVSPGTDTPGMSPDEASSARNFVINSRILEPVSQSGCAFPRNLLRPPAQLLVSPSDPSATPPKPLDFGPFLRYTLARTSTHFSEQKSWFLLTRDAAQGST